MFLKISLAISIIFLLLQPVIAQDKIYLKSKKMIKGKVIQITSTNIEIDPVGEKPFLMISRDSVEVLIYADNSIINFNKPAETKKESSGIKSFKSEQEISFPKSNPLRLKWQKFYVFLNEEIVVNDTINNKALKINCKGYYNIKKSFKTYTIGYIKLEFDVVYDGKVHRDKILIDEKVQHSSSKGDKDAFPGQFILDFGIYSITTKIYSSSGYTGRIKGKTLSKLPISRNYKEGYGFYVNMNIQTN